MVYLRVDSLPNEQGGCSNLTCIGIPYCILCIYDAPCAAAGSRTKEIENDRKYKNKKQQP